MERPLMKLYMVEPLKAATLWKRPPNENGHCTTDCVHSSGSITTTATNRDEGNYELSHIYDDVTLPGRHSHSFDRETARAYLITDTKRRKDRRQGTVMASSHFLSYFLVVLICIATIRAGSLNKRSPSFDEFNSEIMSHELNDIDDRTDRLILRFIDTIIEDARQEGVPAEMLSSMMRKRSGIRKCFFHAINCCHSTAFGAPIDLWCQCTVVK
ncbi:hypothetical protein LSAT2_032474 [Lamellibrachia satsuma]|nr:hypothetical protein LSAT2_032474 [Lamellibrachia satsuma]